MALKATLNIKATDPFANSANILMGDVQQSIRDGIESDDSTTARATATKIDEFARAALGISTATFQDAEISIAYSVNEILAE